MLDATGPAVVVGNSEPEDHLDRSRVGIRGYDVVRRRTGGSAVLVGPGEVLWMDVTVPVADPLWSADVRRGTWWLGECWAAALADVGIGGAEVWRGGMVTSAWSSRVCFAGLGPGEVTLGGAKVVGVAQRRTRLGTLFQCAVPLTKPSTQVPGSWDPYDLLDVLALNPRQRRQAARDLAGVAAAVPNGESLAESLIVRVRASDGVSLP